jgi:flagellar hook-associated protein 2
MDVTSAAGQSIRTLAAQLLSIERRPVDELNARKSAASQQLAGYRDVASKLSALRRIVEDFAAPGSLSALRTMTASAPEDAPFRASVSSTAAPARYDLQVDRLAARHALASSVFSNEGTELVAAAGLGGLALQFTIAANGETKDVSVTIPPEAKDGTVLRAAASALRDAGFTASVVSIGGGRERLLLEAEESGRAGRITSITDAGGQLMARLGLAGAESAEAGLLATVRAGEDAAIVLNGLEIAAPSNVLVDVVPGLTLDLRKAEGAPFALDVTRDTETALRRTSELVQAFNAALDELYALTRPADDEGNGRGILTGTIGLGSLRASFRGILGDLFGTASGERGLSDLGITMNREGRLTLNEAGFKKAFESDPASLEELFNGDRIGRAPRGVPGRVSPRRRRPGPAGVRGPVADRPLLAKDQRRGRGPDRARTGADRASGADAVRDRDPVAAELVARFLLEPAVLAAR